MIELDSTHPTPAKCGPIYLIGAGGIAQDAHLPAYQIAGFTVAGIVDLDQAKAEAVAEKFGISQAYDSLETMVAAAAEDAVFDLCVPASAIAASLEMLPDGAPVLIQKPMGENPEQARAILETCRRKNLIAAVNLQLRFAPFINLARQAIAQGLIGDLVDMEIRVNVETPWHLWDFLNDVPAAELYYHSIHYVDLIRSFLGNPSSVMCKTLRSHTAPAMDSSRSAYLLDYGPDIRVNIQTNHGHSFGRKHQESYVKFEGTRGAIKAQMGVLIDYPQGAGDSFEICTLNADGTPSDWQAIPFEGSWFPHAFIGTMATLMNKVADPSAELPHSVEDVFHTMQVIAAAHQSSLEGGTPVPYQNI